MRRLNTKRLSVLIIIVIIAAGFVVAAASKGVTYCTEKACSCQQGKDEIACNSCGTYNPIFFSILLNYGRACQAKEILECSNGEMTGRHYDIDKENCEYIWNSIFTEFNRDDGMIIFEETSGLN